MKAVIVHSDGRTTDLSQAADPATYAELENTTYTRSSPALWCGTCGGSIYIRHGSKRKDELFGAHHDADSCEARLVINRAGLSDEHKCQAEYHALAAEHPGHRAELEVSTTGRTRVDVVIDQSAGIEVQWSALTRAAAKDRTARSIAAGLRSVTWFTARTENPLWNGHVPGYRTTARPELWKHLPKPRSAYSAGLRIIEAVRCGVRNICQHPRGTGPRFIPWDEPWRFLLVDEVVEGLADGQILPLLLHRNIQLLSAASLSRYEELTGQPLPSYNPGQPETALAPSARQECDRAFQVPDNAPPNVRAWLEAERQRVAKQRDRRDRALLEEMGPRSSEQPGRRYPARRATVAGPVHRRQNRPRTRQATSIGTVAPMAQQCPPGTRIMPTLLPRPRVLPVRPRPVLHPARLQEPPSPRSAMSAALYSRSWQSSAHSGVPSRFLPQAPSP